MGVFKRRKTEEPDQSSAEPRPEVGDWNRVGAKVVHSTFGTGEVVQVGFCKGTEAVWIAFDRGMVRMLDVQVAAPFLRIRGDGERLTRSDPKEKCDICGGRPVVVTIGAGRDAQRFCLVHKREYRG